MLKQVDDFASIECLDWVNYMLTNNQTLFILTLVQTKPIKKKKQIYYVRKKAESDKIIIVALKDNRRNN